MSTAPTKVRERPILFSGPMVRAIRDGRKTQTRRPVRLREFGPSTTTGYDWTFRDRKARWHDHWTASLLAKVAPYRVGDRLYVRETCWQARMPGGINVNGDYEPGSWMSRWSFGNEKPPTEFGFHWVRRPAVHMPKAAARTWLEVTRVRVEQVRDISHADARAEGIADADGFVAVGMTVLTAAFRSLWTETYGADSYGHGWCWVYEFVPVVSS